MDENKIESEHTISSSAGFPANETSDKKIQAVGFGSYVALDGRPVFYTQFIRENSSIGSQQAVESDNSELGTSLISESIQDITIGEQYILMTLMEEGAHILPDAKTIQDYLEIDSVVGGRKYFLVITFE